MSSLTIRFCVLIFLLLFVSMPQLAAGQEDGSEAAEPIEEITVVGEKSTLKLKYEYELAEDSFYELYNELNDD